MLKLQLREAARHGTPDFPVHLYRVRNVGPMPQALPCHWHAEFEVLRVLNGPLQLRIDQETVVADTGSLVWIHAGRLHAATCDPSIIPSYDALVFDLSHLTSGRNDAAWVQVLQPISTGSKRLPTRIPPEHPSFHALQAVTEGLFEAMEQQWSGYELYVRGALQQALALLHAGGLLEAPAVRAAGHQLADQRLHDVLHYMEQHFSEAIPLDSLAQVAGMSRYAFSRFFHRHTGMTPMDALHQHRIQMACDVLRTSRCSVTEAALQCGFESMGYFSGIFKRHTGMTPMQWRKRADGV